MWTENIMHTFRESESEKLTGDFEISSDSKSMFNFSNYSTVSAHQPAYKAATVGTTVKVVIQMLEWVQMLSLFT